jgi:hypothetical protein
MEWKDVGKIIAETAPVLGSLFGPIGSVAGTLVSKVLGVNNDPDTIAETIKNNPEAATKLLSLQAEIIQANQQADTQRLQSINTTIQTEVNSKKWYDHWRSAWGWLSAVSFFTFVGAMTYLLITQPSNAGQILQNLSSISQLFIVPGVILGVVAWHGGKQERLLAGEDNNTLSNLLKKLR